MVLQQGPMHMPGRNLRDLTQFVEAVTAAARVAPDDEYVFQALIHEFASSSQYAASVLALVEDGSRLVLTATSHAATRLQELARLVQAQDIRPQRLSIDLARAPAKPS